MTTPHDAWDGVILAAACAGAPLEDRVAEETFYFDGRAIATMARPGVRMSAHHVLHEVCHFVVATEAERLLPEYGMVRRARAISEGDPEGQLAYGMRVKATLSQQERQVREAATQCVNRALGEELGVLSVFGWDWEKTTRQLGQVCPGWDDRGMAYLESRGVSLHGLLGAPARMAA